MTGAVVLDREQGAWLRRALESLRSGTTRGFEDALWLGFGNDWTPLRDRLIRAGYVRIAPRDGQCSLTERGEQLWTTLGEGRA